MSEDAWLPPQAPGAADPPRYGPEEVPARPFVGKVQRRGVLNPTPPRPRAPVAAPVTPQYTPAPPPPLPLGDPSRPQFARRGSSPGSARGGPPNTAAIGGLGLAITSLVFTFLSLGSIFILTAPTSAAAYYLARTGRRRVQSGELQRGAGEAKWGMNLAIAGLVCAAVFAITWMILYANGIEGSDVRRWLEHARDWLQDPGSGKGAHDARSASLSQTT